MVSSSGKDKGGVQCKRKYQECSERGGLERLTGLARALALAEDGWFAARRRDGSADPENRSEERWRSMAQTGGKGGGRLSPSKNRRLTVTAYFIGTYIFF